jgi:hypothetical protein
MAERRQKGKERVAECSCLEGRLSKSIVVDNPMANTPSQKKETSAEDPFVLSDDDDPVPDLEHDKFKLTNQFPHEELLQALDEENVTGDSLARTQEEQDWNIVRVKFESYWEQKEEKRRKKAESEALHRLEMDALKESIKRSEEVGQNVSRSITGLAQSMQDSIQENNQTMMQAISQMLHDVGFAPGLQSPYSQGQYPLALGFKPPQDVSAMHLPAPATVFTPPATLPGVPAPAFGRTEQNEIEARPSEAVVYDREETPPTHAQGGGTADTFGRSEKNGESEASEASPSRLPLRPDLLWSDRPNTTLPVLAGSENVEPNKGEIPLQGCSEIVPALRKPSLPDDDGYSASMFTTTHCTEVCTGTFVSIPSSGTGNVGRQGGDGEHSGGGG